MKKILTIYVVLTVATTIVLADHVIDESENPQFLFVLSAESGLYDGETLTLTGVSAVVYFSDRPYRIAGNMSVQEFVEMWGEGTDDFVVDPPNAALSILDSNGNYNVVVELIDLQSGSETINFNVRVLQGSIPTSFGVASLFIDTLGGHGTSSW